MKPICAYAELHCISHFTFLRGVSHPEELVERAVTLGYVALALTDECSLGGVVRAHQAAQRQGLHLIIGSEFFLAGNIRVVLLVEDRVGYDALCHLITDARRAAPKGHYLLSLERLSQVQGCSVLYVPGLHPNVSVLEQLHLYFPECLWLGFERFCEDGDDLRLAALRILGDRFKVPLMAASDVHMHVRTRRPLQDTVTAIRLGKTVEQAREFLYSNGERHLRPLETLEALYDTDLLLQTLLISKRCRFSLSELKYEYPREWLPVDQDISSHLRALTLEGARCRWPLGIPEQVQPVLERELALIAELQYEAYFLTVYDLIRFARKRHILCQGRGSAANSVVCYCLGITEVDPARIDVLFERFISRERREPPDIDVDFEHERREEVIQYLFSRYGRDRAAMTASVIRYRPRSALRDVAKALGFPALESARLAKALSWWDGEQDLERRLRQAGLDATTSPVQALIELARALVGSPRHLSQHSGGMVLSHVPLHHLVPVENAAMADRTVIQWDKDDLDALGLLKVDCLALGMLSAIRKTFDLIAKIQGRPFGFSDIPPEDPDVYAMMARADTVGVFQIESRAQMAMLPRLKPATFYDLVVQVAIVRPGPIQGHMVHPYLRRRQGLDPVEYPTPEVRAVLERTLGVPLFQEQVIRLAMVAAGFSAGEADQLRRSMAAWKRAGNLADFEHRLVEGMRQGGYSAAYAQQLFHQILGFGEYGFPESHAASFALLAYVSAWLKYHYPAAYVCALLNSQPMGFYGVAQLIQDARRHGVEFLAVDVQCSDWQSRLDGATGGSLQVQLGLGLVKGLRYQTFLQIAAYRGGRHVAWDALPVSLRDRRLLAQAGAFARVLGNRYQAHWKVMGPAGSELLPAPAEGQPLLKPPTVPENVQADYQQLEFSLAGHPVECWRTRLRAAGALTAAELATCSENCRVRVGGLPILRQRPATASGVVFVTLEDETGSVNLVIWGSVAERDRSLLRALRIIVEGRIQKEGSVLHVVVERLLPWEIVEVQAQTMSGTLSQRTPGRP